MRWSAYPYPARDTSRHGTYWPQRGLSTHGGVLDIWLHTVKVGGTDVHVVNAPQPVMHGAARGQLYGRYAIRFKMDPVAGYKTAWLLWPDDGNRAEGEIDFPEGNLYAGDGRSTIHAFVHPTDGGEQAAFDTGVQEAGGWHTAVIVWTPGRCRFLLDGRQIGTDTHAIPKTPMHWVVQTETQLSGGPPPDDASGHVLIDWVAVYARK
jgi:beta-glucanase (GH16 family)